MNTLARSLRLAAVLTIAVLSPGCSTLSQPATKQKLAATGGWLLDKALDVALGTVVNAAQSQADAGQKADWLDSLATGFRSEATASFGSDDVRRLVAIWTPADKPHWQDLAAQLEQLARKAAAVPPAERPEILARGVELAAQLARSRSAAAMLRPPLETIDFRTERIVEPAGGPFPLVVTRTPEIR